MAYVAITGFRLRSILDAPQFWWHAIRSATQARHAPGILSVDVFAVGDIKHTLTVWQSQEAMQTYVRSGAHLKAMQSFRKFDGAKVYSFEADQAPSRLAAHKLWQSKARAI